MFPPYPFSRCAPYEQARTATYVRRLALPLRAFAVQSRSPFAVQSFTGVWRSKFYQQIQDGFGLLLQGLLTDLQKAPDEQSAYFVFFSLFATYYSTNLCKAKLSMPLVLGALSPSFWTMTLGVTVNPGKISFLNLRGC